MKIKKLFVYIFKLKFAPGISSFLFDFETWARLRPIKKFLKEIDPAANKKIIDIGAGIGRLELALNRRDITIYDLNPDSIKEASKQFPNTKLGSGSKIDFPDNSFDYAISIHTLEHVPSKDREQFLMEMMRISIEGIFINIPEGQYATKLCENFLFSLKKNNLPPNKWTQEHLDCGIPTVAELKQLFERQDKFQITYRFIRNYKSENFFWSKIRATNIRFLKVVLSPFVAIWCGIMFNVGPTIEIEIIGKKAKI